METFKALCSVPIEKHGGNSCQEAQASRCLFTCFSLRHCTGKRALECEDTSCHFRNIVVNIRGYLRACIIRSLYSYYYYFFATTTCSIRVALLRVMSGVTLWDMYIPRWYFLNHNEIVKTVAYSATLLFHLDCSKRWIPLARESEVHNRINKNIFLLAAT